MKLRTHLAVLLGVVLVLAPELAGLRRLGGGALDAWTAPLWAYAHDRVSQHELPLWNPYLFCGMPLVGHPALGVCYPLNWLAWLLSPSTGITVSVLLHLGLSASGAVVLLRRLGCRALVAGAGGLAMAAGCGLTGAIGHLEQLQVWAWWPWLLVCLEADLGLIAALVLGMQGLAGDPFGVQLSAVTAGVWILVSRARTHDMVAGLGNLVGTVTMGLGLAAMQWLPYADMYRHSVRHSGGLSQPTGLAMSHLLWPAGPAPVVLVTALLLSGAAFLGVGRARDVATALVAVAVFCLVMSVGAPANLLAHSWAAQPKVAVQVLGAALQSLVGDEPWRWAGPASLCLALSAALGLEQLFSRKPSLAWAALWVHVGLAVTVGVLQTPVAPAVALEPAVATTISALAGTGRRFAGAGPLALPVWNSGVPVRAGSATGYSAMVPVDVMDVLMWAARASVVADKDRDGLIASGFVIDDHSLADPLLRCMGVDRLVYSPGPNQVPKVNTIEHALPRLRVVDARRAETGSNVGWRALGRERDKPISLSETWPPAEEEDPSPENISTGVFESLSDDTVDHTTLVLLDQAPAVGTVMAHQPPLTSSVHLVEDQPERMAVDVKASATALLVVGDGFDPGWTATVNDHPSRVYAADGLMRAVVVPKGDSHVVFVYSPASWRAGWQLSLLSLVLLVFMAVRDRLRPPRSTTLAHTAPAVVPPREDGTAGDPNG